MSEYLDAAYRYAHRGWPLLKVHYPVDGVCSCGSDHSEDQRPLGKHPATGNGSLDASCDLEAIESWWFEADWNIGVRTGAASGIMAVDVDGPEGVAELEALETKHGELPATFTTRSGRDGVSGHRIYRIPEGRVVKGRQLAPHVDTRGEGGYVILPPSVHRSGRVYEVVDGRDPVECPAWVLDMLEPVVVAPVTAVRNEVDLDVLPEWVRRIFDASPDDRSKQLFRLAAACVNAGLADSDVLGVIAAHPPSVAKYGARLDAEARRVLGKLRAATQREELPATSQSVRDALAECIRVYRKWLYLESDDQVVAALGAAAANALPGDPFWILFVSAPGSGKTETIWPLEALPYVIAAAVFTMPSMLSGTERKNVAKDATGGLLRQIGEFGILLVKDFSGVLGMRHETRAEILAALREVYDGAWHRPLGTDGGRVLVWKGKAGLIGAVTPSIDRHHAVIGALGERFVFYRLHVVDRLEQGARRIRNRRHEASMRAELADAVKGVFAALDTDYDRDLDDREQRHLVALADYVTWARTAVERDGYSRDVEVLPSPEAPARLAGQLATYLIALEAIGADRATAWRVVRKVAFDCLPALRRRVIDVLYDGGEQVSSEVQEAAAAPKTSVDRTFEDLILLGFVAHRKTGEHDTAAWAYRLSDTGERMRRDAG